MRVSHVIFFLTIVLGASLFDTSNFAANGIVEDLQETKTKDTQAIIERIQPFYLPPTKNYQSSATNILKDQYKISNYGTFDFSNGIPWGKSPIKEKEFSRSYYRSLHAHFFLNDLVAAFKETNNEKYIRKAFEIIHDWINENPYKNPAHQMAWHDEGTARRLVTWINYYDVAREILNDDQLETLLRNMEEHAERLSTEQFYSKNTNHGMFQNEALLAFSDYFDGHSKSEEYYKLAKQRLKEYFDFIISENGVHLEHSPGYHQNIATSVKAYKDFFIHKQDKEASNYYTRIYHDMATYLTWVIKPDGTFPLIGDTFKKDSPSDSLWKNNSMYTYSKTSGKEGIQPKKQSMVFEDAGYAIFRDDWKNGIDSTYIHFTAAYHTEYHKHSDDLSIWIYANGQDLITEAGPNGYDYDLPFTEFGYSSFAHNTLIVNDRGLPRVDDQYDKTYLMDYSLDQNISKVSGINKRYPNVSHQRNLEYNRKINQLFVNDKITSTKEHNYKILWHVAEGITPVIKGNRVNLLANGKKVMTIEINATSEFKLYEIKGQTSPYLLGWHLRDRHSPVETSTLVFETESTSTEIKTLFSIK